MGTNLTRKQRALALVCGIPVTDTMTTQELHEKVKPFLKTKEAERRQNKRWSIIREKGLAIGMEVIHPLLGRRKITCINSSGFIFLEGSRYNYSPKHLTVLQPQPD